jgi:hypothetical protein
MPLVRRFHLAALAAVMAGVCVLTLSDTLVGPAMARASVLVDVVRLMVDLISDSTGGSGRLSRSMVPFRTDTIGHFMAWAGVGFLAAGVPATALSRFNLYFGLFALSAFLEAGQRYLTWSRVAEFSDLMANGAGLALGFGCFALVERMVLDRLADSFGPGYPPWRRRISALMAGTT